MIKGDDKSSPSNNPQCKLFSNADATRYVGIPVTGISNAALGSACTWDTADDDSFMIVAVVPKSYHEPNRGASGFRKLPDVGTEGFVQQQLGGWVAGTIVGPSAIRVTINSKTTSSSGAIELLKETIKRVTASGAK